MAIDSRPVGQRSGDAMLAPHVVTRGRKAQDPLRRENCATDDLTQGLIPAPLLPKDLPPFQTFFITSHCRCAISSQLLKQRNESNRPSADNDDEQGLTGLG